LAILSHSDFGLVIWVDYFQVISDLGRHRFSTRHERRKAMTITRNWNTGNMLPNSYSL